MKYCQGVKCFTVLLKPKSLGSYWQMWTVSGPVSVRKGDGLAHVLPMILSSWLPSKQKPLNVSGDVIVSVRWLGLKGTVRLLRRVKAVSKSGPELRFTGLQGYSYTVGFVNLVLHWSSSFHPWCPVPSWWGSDIVANRGQLTPRSKPGWKASRCV